MTDVITANWDTLMSQAQKTAEDYFKESVRILQASELKFTAADAVALAAVMAKDFHSASMGVAVQRVALELHNIHSEVADIAYEFGQRI